MQVWMRRAMALVLGFTLTTASAAEREPYLQAGLRWDFGGSQPSATGQWHAVAESGWRSTGTLYAASTPALQAQIPLFPPSVEASAPLQLQAMSSGERAAVIAAGVVVTVIGAFAVARALGRKAEEFLEAITPPPNEGGSQNSPPPGCGLPVCPGG